MRFLKSCMGHITQHFGCDTPLAYVKCDSLRWSCCSNLALRRSPCLGDKVASYGKFARSWHFRVSISDLNQIVAVSPSVVSLNLDARSIRETSTSGEESRYTPRHPGCFLDRIPGFQYSAEEGRRCSDPCPRTPPGRQKRGDRIFTHIGKVRNG
jgi:hypothetical protein